MEDYELGKTYIDPKHVADGGVTPDHVRRWKVLQELQVSHAIVLTCHYRRVYVPLGDSWLGKWPGCIAGC